MGPVWASPGSVLRLVLRLILGLVLRLVLRLILGLIIELYLRYIQSNGRMNQLIYNITQFAMDPAGLALVSTRYSTLPVPP